MKSIIILMLAVVGSLSAKAETECVGRFSFSNADGTKQVKPVKIQYSPDSVKISRGSDVLSFEGAARLLDRNVVLDTTNPDTGERISGSLGYEGTTQFNGQIQTQGKIYPLVGSVECLRKNLSGIADRRSTDIIKDFGAYKYLCVGDWVKLLDGENSLSYDKSTDYLVVGFNITQGGFYIRPIHISGEIRLVRKEFLGGHMFTTSCDPVARKASMDK